MSSPRTSTGKQATATAGLRAALPVLTGAVVGLFPATSGRLPESAYRAAFLMIAACFGLATLGAFIYNMAASLLGGIEITLAEDLR